MVALADQCLADYDENGWRDSELLNPGAVAYSGYASQTPPTIDSRGTIETDA